MEAAAIVVTSLNTEFASNKGVKMAALLERDTDFCSGEDEEDLDADIHSPTDASEDSVEVRVKPITNLRGGCRNKRKCAEPRKVADEVKRRLTSYKGTASQVTNAYIPGQSVTGGGHDTGVFRGPSSLTPQDVSAYRGSPLIQLDTSPYRRSLTPHDSNPSSPFRPWSHQPLPPPTPSGYQPTVYYRIASPQQDTDQDQPLALVSKDKYHHDHDPRESQRSTTSSSLRSLSTSVQDRLQSSSVATFSQQGKSRPRPQDVVRLKREPETPEISVIADSRRCHSDNNNTSSHNGRSNGELTVEDLSGGKNGRSFSVESLIGGDKHDVTFNNPSTSTSKKTSTCHQTQQRNYKNMTRERRIEANARERTRVHTISAAFDTLRRAVPAYSHNQKLSKLSVLRIACSYILTLSRVAGSDYSSDQSSPSLAECVDNVSKTIQMEGKLRKKKDE